MNQWLPTDEEMAARSAQTSNARFFGLDREGPSFRFDAKSTWTERLGYRWYAARRWIATKILRVSAE